MKNKMKRVLGIILCLMLVLGRLPEMSVLASDDSESFTLGSFDYTTSTFKDASGTGSEKYKTLMIAYGRETYRSTSVREYLELPNMEGFVKNNDAGTNYSTVITMEDGKTTAEIADYVKQIVFVNSIIEGQDIQITITDQVINTKTFYFEGTKHYYQYIAYTGGTNTWTDAYNAAKGMTYAGRQGYLATVTSLEEDMFIYRAANTVGWLGGTTLPHGEKSGNYYENFTTDASEDVINDSNWYWACGPEIGTEFFGKNSNDSSTRSNAYEEAKNNGYYANWDTEGEPTLNEPCLTTLRKGNGYKTYPQGVSDYSWNNLSHASDYNPGWPYSVLGYFVEYGDQTVGDSGSGAAGVVTAGGTIAPVTNTVTFDAGTGTGTMAPVTAKVLYELPQCTFTAPSGLVFVGWKDDYGVNHAVGETVNTSNLNHFVAQWGDKAVATFDSCGGSGSGPESISKVPGTVITLPANTFTAPDGKYFAGWSDGTNTYQEGASYTLNVNVTFTAQWVNRILVNDGTDTNEYLPVYGNWVDGISKGQFIIPSADLTDMNGGTITGLTFYADNPNTSWEGARFEVYMLETEATNVSSLTDWGTMTLVRNAGSLSIENYKMTVTLDNPFVYRGGNLLIGVLETVSGEYEWCYWYGVETSNTSMGGHDDSVYEQDFLPKTLFDYIASAPIPIYTVTLTGGANATSGGGDTTQSDLSGEMATVTYTANTGYYFPEFDDIANNGITATRTSDTVVTVSGSPTADASIKVPDAVARPTISQTVTFKVVNGSWDDGTTTDKTLTVTGHAGDTLKLAENLIPAVGSKPNGGYKAGGWDTTPSADTEITEATTYTYTYAVNEAGGDTGTSSQPYIPIVIPAWPTATPEPTPVSDITGTPEDPSVPTEAPGDAEPTSAPADDTATDTTEPSDTTSETTTDTPGTSDPAEGEEDETPYKDVTIDAGFIRDITGTREATAESNPYETKIVNNSELKSLLRIADTEEDEGVNVWLDIQDISDTISEEEKEQIAEASTDGYTVALFLDASLFMKVGDNAPEKITETNGKIKVSIVIPEELRADDRSYEIIRLHDGAATVLQGVYDPEDYTFTFETDRFSAYAVAYKEQAGGAADSGEDTASETLPQTGLRPVDVFYGFGLAVICYGAVICVRDIWRRREEKG